MNELEKCVQLVRDCGLTTGHAETHEELLREVLEQYEDRRERIAELEQRLNTITKEAATAVQRHEQLQREVESAIASLVKERDEARALCAEIRARVLSVVPYSASLWITDFCQNSAFPWEE